MKTLITFCLTSIAIIQFTLPNESNRSEKPPNDHLVWIDKEKLGPEKTQIDSNFLNARIFIEPSQGHVVIIRALQDPRIYSFGEEFPKTHNLNDHILVINDSVSIDLFYITSELSETNEMISDTLGPLPLVYKE